MTGLIGIGLLVYVVSWAFLYGFIRTTIPNVKFRQIAYALICGPFMLAVVLLWLILNRLARLGECVGEMHNAANKTESNGSTPT